MRQNSWEYRDTVIATQFRSQFISAISQTNLQWKGYLKPLESACFFLALFQVDKRALVACNQVIFKWLDDRRGYF